MTRILIGVFLMVHGLVHAGLAAAPIPKDASSRPGSFFTHPSRSWVLRRLRISSGGVRAIGWLLVVMTSLGFVLAGLAALGVPLLAGAIAPLVVCSAILSLVLVVVFWHPWLTLGALIDLAILVIWIIRRL